MLLNLIFQGISLAFCIIHDIVELANCCMLGGGGWGGDSGGFVVKI